MMAALLRIYFEIVKIENLTKEAGENIQIESVKTFLGGILSLIFCLSHCDGKCNSGLLTENAYKTWSPIHFGVFLGKRFTKTAASFVNLEWIQPITK